MRQRPLAIAIPPIALLLLLATAPLPAATPPPPLVDPAILQPLLPAAPEGWTVARARHDRINAPDYTYSFAEAQFRKDDMKVRLTVADTDGESAALNILATMVLSLPEGFAETVPPATAVRRMTVNGYQAAERWSTRDLDGELTVLVENRFVVKAEGSALPGPEMLRTMLDLIDLKKVAALK